MKFTRPTPCDACPFLEKYRHGYTLERLQEFAYRPAGGVFPCHKTCAVDEDGEDATGEFVETEKTVACAGALIFETLNYGGTLAAEWKMYDPEKYKLDLTAPVRHKD